MSSSIKEILVLSLDQLHIFFPHIAIDIELGWGTKGCHKYLQSLLNKDRKDRRGFPSGAYYQILHIYFLHVKEFGDQGIPLTLPNANINISRII